jgi:hypothetical protein
MRSPSRQGCRRPPGGEYGAAYYDVEARAEGDRARTRDEFRPMLQTLLADRFKLKLHRAAKQMPVYALAVRSDGPKFRESAPTPQKAIVEILVVDHVEEPSLN